MMSPPPPLNERSHQASTSSTAAPPYSSAGRRNMYGASRQPLYSSLGDALGGSGMHQPQQQQQHSSGGSGPAGSEYSVSSGSAHLPPPPPPPTHHPHISPDGRTQYTPSGLPSYEYPYQSGSYAEPMSQYGHSSLPPMRTASPAASYATLNQPIAHYNAHSAPYTSAYPQPPYILTDKEWTQSPQAFTAEAVPPMFVAGHSDVSTSPQVDQRSYVQPQYTPPPANIHPEERSYSGELSPSSKGKTRDHETARTYRSPSSSFGSPVRDFNKLSSTYGQLYAECSAISQRGVPGTPDSLAEIDGMLRSARLGLHLLHPAFVPAISAQHRRSSEESRNSAELENASTELPAKRQADSAPASDGQKCLGCGATATPEWRRGPLGPRTLCNACGLVYAKMIKKRGRDTRPNPGNPSSRAQNRMAPAQTMVDEAHSLDSPGDHSDGELSYGSQDPN